MDNHYGGVIWTNHALERLRERGISQGDALATFNRPEQSRAGSNQRGSWVYYRTYGNEKIEVVAKKNENGEWIILSVWSRPVDGRYQKKEKTGILHWFLKFIFG
jgi:hypothetical protein